MDKKGSSIILGVDPGTVVTGYALITSQEGRMNLLDFGCIRPPPKMPLFDRYLIIHESIEKLLVKHSPTALAVETQFVSRNPQSAMKLGMARGVIIIAARKKGVEVFEYPPKKAKKALTGQGNASKRQVQYMIQTLFQLPKLPEPEDAADALSIAICHAHREQKTCNIS